MLFRSIIVKDLSRFGRETIEMGRLTQVVYPSLGITFIAIQENVNTNTGTGLEMMPFYNIFNEWYAEQTSKKIKAVWKSKADNGERVSSAVPFGYMKSPDNPKQWIIDEPAAKVVRYIFELCPWTAAYQAPPSMGFSRQEYLVMLYLPGDNQF